MNREQCYIYKVYLVEFEVNNRSNGYAVVSARNMREATSLLQNHGVNHENYKIVTVKEWPYAPIKAQYPSILQEGIVTQGKSAYESALDSGFKGSEEEWIASFSNGLQLKKINDTTYGMFNAQGILQGDQISLVPPSMRIERDKTNPQIYNLVDAENKTHGSIEIPKETHIISAVYDNTLQTITFKYNAGSGKEQFSLDVSELRKIQYGDGLTDTGGKLHILLDPASHAALSTSSAGLKLDGKYFAKSENELFLTEYSSKVYKDY